MQSWIFKLLLNLKLLTLEKPALTSEHSGSIARAVLTPGGFMPWTVMEIWADHETVHKWGMLTAPWCGKTISIQELLEKNAARCRTILSNNMNAATSLLADKIGVYYPNQKPDKVFLGYQPGLETALQAFTDAKFNSLSPYAQCYALAVFTYRADRKAEAASAMFSFVACIAKGGNATDAWIKKRIANFKKNSAFEGLTAPTTDEMQKFASHYLPSTVSPQQYCEVLRLYYRTFTEDDFQKGKWLIEQAPGMNSSALHAIAEVIGERQLSYEFLCVAAA